MSIESRKILELAKQFQEEAQQTMIASREREGRKDMDHELQKILLQLLGALNHASHMITQVLSNDQLTNSREPVEHQELEAAPQALVGPGVSSTLDRLNEERDREQAAELEAEVPRPRTRGRPFHPSKQDLEDMRKEMTVKEISEKYQTSMATVMNRLREAGMTKPREAGKRGGRPKRKG